MLARTIGTRHHDRCVRARTLLIARRESRRRLAVIARLPEFDALCDQARDIKDHVLDNLDHYLTIFEARVIASGGRVHWCRDAGEARAVILDICEAAGARLVTKGKSMVAEEIALNPHLEAAGIEVVETDLGEYIIQLRGEAPSHIIAPAIHVRQAGVAAAFRRAHDGLDPARDLDHADDLLAEARTMLRQKFLDADVGITGANLLIAETGTTVIVTNEGNGHLTQTLPKTHVVLASIEKIVPTLEDATTILRVATELVRQQEGFLNHGVQHLRPLVLRNIAEAIDMHDSTVSRVTANKYMITPRGIFEMRYFFTTAIASSHGGEAAHSSESVRHRIKALIDAEVAGATLSDDRLTAILRDEGIDIARRTIAKYREAMNIPSSMRRKRTLARALARNAG